MAFVGSTGAPSVVLDILGSLPRPYPVPILVLMHLGPGFEDGFVSWIERASGHQTYLAESGMSPRSGVYVAPPGLDLAVDEHRCFAFTPPRPGQVHVPSGDALFSSLAATYRNGAVGVLLSGMGRDGAAGLLDLRRRGALTVTQDADSCLVDGMPAAARKVGASELELTPEDISVLLSQARDRKPGGAQPK